VASELVKRAIEEILRILRTLNAPSCFRSTVAKESFLGKTTMYAASYLSTFLVPAVGILFPLAGMGLLFLYIEKEA
jgi:negative regulator of replication initiation